jgi:sugar phosphate isomerase/epimerase
MSGIMLNRRKFLALSAAAWPAMALGAGKHIPLGVQLYTIRDLVKSNNLLDLLKQVRAIGYEEIELYESLYTHPARELSSIAHRAGLAPTSGAFDYNDFPAKITYARRLGLKWMVCPILPQTQWASPEGFRRAAAAFNQWGKECQKQGMRFAYHNHNYEFQDLKGTTGFDILLKETDPELVWLEMDSYWIAQAGRDPVLLLNQLGRRVRLLHLRDRKADVPTSQALDDSAEHFTEVGSGTIRWRPLLALAQKLGIEHYFVEQDKSTTSAMDSLKTSYAFLHKILS